jgi:hypothetical protein
MLIKPFISYRQFTYDNPCTTIIHYYAITSTIIEHNHCTSEFQPNTHNYLYHPHN